MSSAGRLGVMPQGVQQQFIMRASWHVLFCPMDCMDKRIADVNITYIRSFEIPAPSFSTTCSTQQLDLQTQHVSWN